MTQEEIPPIPPRIYKAVAHLEKTKKPGERVRLHELSPTTGAGNYVEWLLLLNVVKVIPPERSIPDLSPFKEIPRRHNPSDRHFEYVGTPEGWKDQQP